MAFDELHFRLYDLSSKYQLIAATYSEEMTRNAARAAFEKLTTLRNNLYLNADLYHALKDYATTTESKRLPSNQQKFLRETILLFEKNGMKLSAANRKDLEGINQKITYYAVQFDKNIAESKDSIEFNKEELAGIADHIKASWKRANDKFVIYINAPNHNNVTRYAENAEIRHTMHLRYNNRSYPENLNVLDSLLYYRNLLARKLGFRSFAEYTVIDKMAATPENVWDFKYNLVNKLTPQLSKELKELQELKTKMDANATDTLYAWDVNYYLNKLLEHKYQLNTNEVSQYFEINNTVQGMFQVFEKLFAIQIKELKNIPGWHAKVKSYEMFKDGKKVGSFYLDLYPRPNKYTHNACFTISLYHKEGGHEVLPVSALICNLPEGSDTSVALLHHNSVITLFHEFGHLIHSMLGRSDIASQRPLSMKWDFTEAPSQLLENWCWEYESLKLFARHYKTGETLPEALFNKLKEAQLIGSSHLSMRQLYMGIVDFTFADKYDSIKGKDLTQVSKDLYAITQLPFAEGSHFICSFTHLTSYGANYYGYLWSKVFAQDMFTVFQKNGVMDTKTGKRYRKEILEKGASTEEMTLVRNFLGREPNSNAFLKSLGIQ
jgi:thimet oligopeptidase